MNRVERSYRRLIRLLPAEEREARGEEFLGLLLDLEGDRERPSAREVATLLALAARLHARQLGLGRIAAGLFAVYLLVFATTTPAQMLANAVVPGAGSPFVGYDLALLLFGLARLGVALAWIFRCYRTALILFGLLAVESVRDLASSYVPGTGFGFFVFMLGGYPGLIWEAACCLGVPVLLGLAIRREPRRVAPRFGLAGLAIAFAVQGALFLGTGPVLDSEPADFTQRHAVWLLVAACAALAAGHARHRAPHVRWAAIATACAGGWLLSLAMPGLDAATVAVTACALEGARAIVGRRARVRSRTA